MTATTKGGIATIVSGVAAFVVAGLTKGLWLDPAVLLTLITAITGGLGLIFAKTGSPST